MDVVLTFFIVLSIFSCLVVLCIMAVERQMQERKRR